MSHLRIAHVNQSDDATLSAVPDTAVNMTVDSLRNDARGAVMRSTGMSQDIKGTWGGVARALGCCVLYRHNLVDGDTWRLRLYSDASWTTLVYDSGAVAAYPAGAFGAWDWGFSVMWLAEVSARSFTLSLQSSGPDGYIEAGRLLLGPYMEVAYNPEWGMKCGYQPSGVQRRLTGGSLHASAKGKWRAMAFDIFARTEADRAAWMEIGRYAGNDKTVFISAFPAATDATWRDFSILGKFVQTPEQVLSRLNMYDHSINITEI